MQEQETTTPPKTDPDKKPGFFKRFFDKVDTAMKEKADKKADENSCCGPDDKGGKCC